MSTVSVHAEFDVTTTETLATVTAPASSRRVLSHNAFDASLELNASSTPPSTHAGYENPSGSSGSIDLTALVTADGVKDTSGKRLRILRVKNMNAAGNVTIAVGASNGYAIGGATITLTPGEIFQRYFVSALTVVDGTHKTLDWTNAGDLVAPQITIIMG